MTQPSEAKPGARHRTIDRAAQILEFAARSQSGATLSEIAKTLGAPVSSVRGLVNGLIATGYLAEHNHRYVLGSAARPPQPHGGTPTGFHRHARRSGTHPRAVRADHRAVHRRRPQYLLRRLLLIGPTTDSSRHYPGSKRPESARRPTLPSMATVFPSPCAKTARPSRPSASSRPTRTFPHVATS